jgi:hypothetical protein
MALPSAPLLLIHHTPRRNASIRQACPPRASQWVFDKLENHTKLPLADVAAILNAEERSKNVF